MCLLTEQQELDVPIPVVTEAKTKSLLKAVPYFRLLDDDALVAVAHNVVTRRYQEGETIFLEGEPDAGLHLVAKGRCKIYRMSEQGREHILAIIGPGDSCNEVPVVDGGANPASLVTMEATTVWVISAEVLRQLRQDFPHLNDMIIENLAMRCRQLVQRVYNLSFLSVTGRLADFLLRQCEADGELNRHRWTQEEIAAHLGTVREMVGRALRELQEAELIILDRHRIEILDKAGLEALI
jgi:CRP/FNR family transcriptional regulator